MFILATMFASIVQGISLGLVLALMIGPVFFLILQTSLKKGFKPAAYLAAGVLISDGCFICIAVFGSSKLHHIQKFDIISAYVGGLLLIVFGIMSAFKRPHMKTDGIDLPDDSKTMLIDTAKGFMMNTLNPFVLIFWLGVVSAIHTGKIGGGRDQLVFFSFVLITVFTTDMLKAYLASRLKAVLTDHFLLWLNRISGIGLILFGIRLIYTIS
jgi:threonine/homoserine/homoserine lactone efflux protein